MANEKFSQFASGGNVQAGDIVVGLRAGVNTQFTSSSSTNSNVYAPAILFSDVNLPSTYNNGAAGVGATLTGTANGLLVIDTIAVQVGNRIIVSEQSSAIENGIYVVTQTGSVGTPFILTRATDFDTPAKIVEGGIIPVVTGADYVGSVAVVASAPAVIGVNLVGITSTMEQALVILKFIQAANNLADVASPITAFDNLSPVNNKGALLGFTGTISAESNLPVADGYVVTSDSTQPVGFKWAPAPSSGLSFTAKGQLITYDGTVVDYLNVGADNFVLTADSSQTNGLKWDAAPPPSFTYPYTFTGNNVLFDFAPTMNWATANCVIYTDAAKNLATTANFRYIDTTNQLIHATAPGSITNNNVAVLSSNAPSVGADLVFIGASDTVSITTPNSTVIAATNVSILPGGDHNFVAATNNAGINNNAALSVILGSTNATIDTGSSTCGIFAANGTVSGLFSTLIGSDSTGLGITGSYCSILGGNANSITANYSVILGGQTNSITGGVNGIIAGGANNVVNGDHNFIAGADSSTANGVACVLFGDDITSSTNHSFMFNDGIAPQALNTPNSFNVVAARGVAIGGVNPNLFCSIELKETNKTLRLNNVSGTATITTPLAGMTLFDTTTNQFMGYNGTAWIVLG